MTMPIDFALLEAQKGPEITLLGRTAAETDGQGEARSGFGSLAHLDLRIRVDRLSGDSSPALTVVVEQSQDGESWTTAAEHEFTRDGSYRAVLPTPQDQLRVSWSVAGGLLEATIGGVTVVPSFFADVVVPPPIPVSEPAAESLSAGELVLWYDDTAGSPTLRAKAKDASGDLFTATIPLTVAP